MPIPVFNPLQNQSITSAMVNLTYGSTSVATQETSTSTTYTDLATAGPATTISPGVIQDHLILIVSIGSNAAGDRHYHSVAIAAAAAADADAGQGSWNNATVGDGVHSSHALAAAAASGAVHTSKYRTPSNTGRWQNRRVTAVAI